MRTISPTRSSPATASTVADVTPPSTVFSIRKWLAGKRRHLRQVGDAEHLRVVREFPQPLADRPRGRAADPGVDLVEDARRAAASAREARQREHHAGELTARRRVAQRRDGHPRVRCDPELDRLRAACAESVRLGGRAERNLQARAVHRQPRERLGDGLLELRSRLLARLVSFAASPARSERDTSTRCASSPASSSAPSSRSISARQRSAWAITASIEPPCFRSSRSISARRSSTASRRPGSASIASS